MFSNPLGFSRLRPDSTLSVFLRLYLVNFYTNSLYVTCEVFSSKKTRSGAVTALVQVLFGGHILSPHCAEESIALLLTRTESPRGGHPSHLSFPGVENVLQRDYLTWC